MRDAVENCGNRYDEEEINHRTAIINKINDSITITRNKDGFQADIEGLDLSFLDVRRKEPSINMNVTFKINVSNHESGPDEA